jgi:hypothetical protein
MSMLFWRWMAVVSAIFAALQFVSASYFVSGRWNVSACRYLLRSDGSPRKGRRPGLNIRGNFWN